MRGLVALALVAAAAAHAEAPADAFPDVAAAYLVDVDGARRWAAHEHRRLPPASLAKLMTVLLVAESGKPDEVVTIGAGAAAATGARLGLKKGERIRVSALLAATLIQSANDACSALAQWQAGSQAAFVARMNRRAAQLGLADTVFADACGHDSPRAHSTARDLAVLAGRVMEVPALAALVAMEKQDIRTEAGRVFHLATTNALLGRVPGVRGVKTGYTPAAGTCVVAYAERDGIRVLIVLLHARDRWWDAAAMIERAFADAQTPRRAP
jgi:D-alanyl-D-alanine carboxypeptidase (penicillin-binding protein 5/6)